jgi:nucleotide-binding universal stress UspA family protein
MRMVQPARNLFRSILCPVDFSSHARLALQYADLVASRSGGQLTALFVSDPLLVAAAAAASYDASALGAASETELRDFVGGALGRPPSHPGGVTCSVVQGDPPAEIQKAVRRLSADLVVMGTQGLSGAGKLFFGSTTERVLRRTTVPVLTIPPATTRRKLPAGWPGHRILGAIDLGNPARAEVRAAARVAQWSGADLLLLHVVRPTQAPRWISERLETHERTRLATARARLERLVGEAAGDHAVRCQVVLGDPAEEIAAVATDIKASLIVVTLRDVGGLFGSPQGSTTYRVLGGTNVPVLALPKNWGVASRR